MKKITWLIIISLFILTFCSCDKENINGDCENPPIKGKREYTISKSDTLLDIKTTDTRYWCFRSLTKCLPADTIHYFYSDSEYLSSDTILIWENEKGTSRYVEIINRVNDTVSCEGITAWKGGKGLKIKISNNQEGTDLTYHIGIQAGNCFNGFKINQLSD